MQKRFDLEIEIGVCALHRVIEPEEELIVVRPGLEAVIDAMDHLARAIERPLIELGEQARQVRIRRRDIGFDLAHSYIPGSHDCSTSPGGAVAMDRFPS